ncbi:hypothetical protein EWM64_g2578 [Hericium alpestre]|uniref:NmrA-like domain-containing protein n=1 Tax=Hericium alpestre TaxID=135208 RepID=A0A4Z0A528_9AGAM|nr:hypothetical protein EWM64_g2578 [Hericium alpestre]
MSTFKNFAIAGVGNIGAVIAEELLSLKASGKVKEVVLLTRSSTKNESIDKLVSQGARVAAVDYSSQNALESVLTGIDVVISTVSINALDFQASLAQAARLQALLGFDLANGKASYGADGNALITFTSRHDIARFLAHIVTTLPAEKLYWSTFRIEGDRISFNEILRQYQEKTDKKVDVTLRSTEELEAALKVNAYDIFSALHLAWARGEGIVGKPEEVSNGMWPEWNPKKVIELITP